MGCRTGCPAAGSAHWTGTLELSGMVLFRRLLSCYPWDSRAGHCSESCWHPVSPCQAPFPHLILHHFLVAHGAPLSVCSAHPLCCHLLASLSPSSASRSYTAPAFPQAPLPIVSPLCSPVSSAVPLSAKQNPYAPSHRPLHCLGPAPDTLPSPCFFSSSGRLLPLTFHKMLSVFGCPSYSPPPSPVPGADVSAVVSSSAFLCLQRSPDSRLGIPLVFLNFLLSGQCKNSFGLFIARFMDYFSSLRFYRSPSLHLALGHAVTSAERWVCSRLTGTSSSSPASLPLF